MAVATANSQIIGTRRGAPDDMRLRAAVDRLVEATDPDFVLLFGSRARGDHHDASDFDLYVLVPETRPFGRKSPFWLWHLVRDLGLRVDVLMRQTALFERHRDAVNTLDNAVWTEGIVLYQRGHSL